MKLSNIHLTLGEQRKIRGLAQKDVAEALNVEQATVSMYENGKRGIPLDLLDDWLHLLEIEIKVIPKGFEPVKPAGDIEHDLGRFNDLKKRRNYLIAEMRAMMAEKVLQRPEFQKTVEETGEGAFWPYSLHADEFIGLIETRYDHPEQKYMAIEYTEEEVNAYKFLPAHETGSDKSDQEWLGVNRVYFSEDDFLRLSAQWDLDTLEMRKMTILRKSSVHTDGVEIIDPEGFSIRTLVEMMENHKCFTEVVKEIGVDWKYISMEQELDAIGDEMLDIVSRNRLVNGKSDPDFIFWTDEDLITIDVPLVEIPRSWSWIEEGVQWVEDYREMDEIQILGDSVPHEHFFTHRNENGSRVMGLVGPEQKPAVFKSNPNRPNTIYRVETKREDLSEMELADYRSILDAAEELKELKQTAGMEEAAE